jgi:5-methylcytosine-specific restriction enzyme subunit McrC
MNTPQIIPIENIYFLFCYAWDRFEEAKAIPLGGTASPDLPNLLARVLLLGTRSLLRRGLDRDYQLIRDEIPTVRGHIQLSETMRLQARTVRRLVCEFDELNHDLLHNQIIKASLRRLAIAPTIDPDIARDLKITARNMGAYPTFGWTGLPSQGCGCIGTMPIMILC